MRAWSRRWFYAQVQGFSTRRFRWRTHVLCAIAFLCGHVLAAGGSEDFAGRLVLEWVDDSPFIASMRLVEPFSFTRNDGEAWTVPAGSLVDGRSLSPMFVRLMGHPFEGSYRKTAVIYDHAVKSKAREWEQAQHVFFEASVSEGILPIEAKVMYLLLRATGSRWALRDSSTCFINCHPGASELVWRPLFVEEQVLALAGWVRSDDPDLSEIDAAVEKRLLHPGPHVFAHVK